MLDKQVQEPTPEANLSRVNTNKSFVSEFLVRHKTYIALLFVIASAIVFFMLFSKPKNEAVTYAVTSGPLKHYVKVSGQVQAATDANLSFQTNGAVAFVGVKKGDKVEQGKVLVTLSAGDAQASLLKTQANLASAQAALNQLQQGAQREEIAYKEQVLENTKRTLFESYGDLPDVIQNIDAVTADSIKNKFSPLFTNSNGKYLLSFSSCDQRLQRDIEVKRTELESTLADFQTKSSVITAISSKEAIDTAFEQGYQAAILTNNLVSSVSGLLLLSCSLSNTSLDGYRTTLSSVKSSMTALFSSITIKRSTLTSYKNAFKQATYDLELSQAKTDPYKMQTKRANVELLQTQVTQAKSHLSKTILKAPFGGVISNVAVSVGEDVNQEKVAVSMLSIDGLEIEAKVPEVDIVKIKVGATVEVTLDAYGTDAVFPATVTSISSATTTKGTGTFYKVMVTFIGKDELIKQGMKANVNIVTEDKHNVISLPARYVRVISTEKGEILVLQNGARVSKTVTIGIRGSEGELEIRSGLMEGEKVLMLP